MQFDVRALSPEQDVVHLIIRARDATDARLQIELQGLLPTTILATAPKTFLWRSGYRRTTIRLSLTLFSEELLALLAAGLGVVEALEALLEKEENAATAAMLANLLSGLRDGKRFSAVLAEQEKVFPALFVGIIGAAEHTSDLPRALSRYIAYQKRIDKLREKLVSAAIYPLILVAVGTCVSLFLVGYVVPQFAEVYQSAGRTLPWFSQLVLRGGKIIKEHGIQLLPLLALSIFALSNAIPDMFSRVAIMGALSHVPGISGRIKIIQLTRLYLTLGMLLEGGINIVTAIDTVQTAVSAELQSSLVAAKQAIQSGEMLSNAFEANGLGTPISLRMLRVGERSGALGPMLAQSAHFYDSQTSRWIDHAVRLFEPLLMLAIGLIVGTIVVMLYLPIFDLAGGLT